MERLAPSKTPTRDYQALSDTPWDLWDALYGRRSHRKYLPYEMDDELTSGLADVIALACDARGAARGSIVAVTEQAAVDRVKRSAYKGISGKINVWLRRAPLAAVLVLDLPGPDVHAQRPVELPKTVMATEDMVLWLTERGLGSCWLAGVSEREVIKAADLGSGRAVPSIISVGKPALEVPRRTSYGGISYHAMSRRRKPLSRIACIESARTPYEPLEETPGSFSAVQADVMGLLGMLRDGAAGPADARAPLPLAIDACLEAARVAPSGNNAQAWQFVVVKDRNRLEELSGLCTSSAGDDWSAAIIAAGQDRKIGNMLMDKPFWDIDVPIAMSHISLMASSMGYAPEVLTGGLDEKGVCRLAALASGMRVVGVIGLH